MRAKTNAKDKFVPYTLTISIDTEEDENTIRVITNLPSGFNIIGDTSEIYYAVTEQAVQNDDFSDQFDAYVTAIVNWWKSNNE